MVNRYVMNSEHDLFIDCLPYEWRSGTSDGLFLPIYLSRGMRSSTLLRGLINFMSSLWLMWVHGLYAHLPFRKFLASSVPRIALSHLESWCKLRRCMQTPWYEVGAYHKPTIYLPQNSHHTYLLWHFHSHSEIYCHATSTIASLSNTMHFSPVSYTHHMPSSKQPPYLPIMAFP